MLRPMGPCIHLKFALTTFCVVLIHIVITPFNVVILDSSTAKDCPVLQQSWGMNIKYKKFKKKFPSVLMEL